MLSSSDNIISFTTDSIRTSFGIKRPGAGAEVTAGVFADIIINVGAFKRIKI